MYVANEGKLVAFCAPEDAEALLATMKSHPLGRDAAIIGEVIADEHAPKPGFYGRCVNWVARAQIQREVWRPLELCCEDFQLQRYRSHWSHGGDFVIASGRKAMP